jgi:hypothetical protein
MFLPFAQLSFAPLWLTSPLHLPQITTNYQIIIRHSGLQIIKSSSATADFKSSSATADIKFSNHLSQN